MNDAAQKAAANIPDGVDKEEFLRMSRLAVSLDAEAKRVRGLALDAYKRAAMSAPRKPRRDVVRGNDGTVLRALCRMADAQGFVRVSYADIERRTGLRADPTVSLAMRRLLVDEMIDVVSPRRGIKPPTYRVIAWVQEGSPS